MKWDEAAIEGAIRGLAVRDDGKAPEVSEMVEMIRLGVWSGQMNTRARARHATRAQTMKDLEVLCKLCFELFDHIENKMRSPALRMVETKLREGRDERKDRGERPLYHPLLLTIQLAGTLEAAEAAWQQAKDGADLPQPAKRGTTVAAKEITFICARVFESVTGRAPARDYDAYAAREGGSFLDFVGKIFTALDVKAKPAGQVRMFMEKSAAGNV